MRGVLSTISVDDLVDSVVTTQWEVNFEDVIAWLHKAQDSLHLLALLFERSTLLHVLDQ